MNRFCKLIFAAPFFIGMVTMAQAAEQQGASETSSSGTFQVRISKGSLSLQAHDAPVVQIFNEIGRQSRITIDSNVAPEETITIRLDHVPLEEGLKRLAQNVSVIYAQGPTDKTRRIERVVVLSERKGVSGQVKTSAQSERVGESVPQQSKVTKPPPEPFKFQFDPSKVGGEDKAEKKAR